MPRVFLGALPAWAWVSIAAVAVFGAVRWGLVLGVVVSLSIAGLAIRVKRSRPHGAQSVWIVFTAVALGPLAVALIIYAVTPTYYRPLVTSIVGWVTLAVIGWAQFGALGLSELGVRQVDKGRPALGAAILTVVTLLAGLVLLGVVLGPSTIVLLRPHYVSSQ